MPMSIPRQPSFLSQFLGRGFDHRPAYSFLLAARFGRHGRERHAAAFMRTTSAASALYLSPLD